ncbi:MAG: PHP domain-containing protein, partial [Caldilineaceae bacterium]|nr:PHP domain-containing protein [Caldilineaceae bacterium]
MEKQQPKILVDLHTHSSCSDGTDSPRELVERAAQLGILVLALTDHDTVRGIDEALAAGAAHDVQIVPALEFSTRNEPDRDFSEINILAYGIRHDDADLLDLLDRVLESRIEQKIRQVERLQSYGVRVPVDEVLAESKGVPGRVHIAEVALRHNPERFRTINDVFDQFLTIGAPNSTYVPRSFSLRVEEAIEVTHAAGGLAVLAHPGSYIRIQSIDDVVRRLAQSGLDGLEVDYNYAHNRGHRQTAPTTVLSMIADFAK